MGRRAAAMLWSATEGVHASFGPHAGVFAFGNGLRGFAMDSRNVIVDWTGNLVTWNPGSLIPRESYIAGFCMGNGNEAVALHTRVAERKMVQ